MARMYTCPSCRLEWCGPAGRPCPSCGEPIIDPFEEIERLRAIIASFAGCGKTNDCANLGSDDCIDDCGHAAEHYKGGDE